MDEIIESILNAVKSDPPGTYKLLKGYGTGVEKDINTHLINRQQVNDHISCAFQSGYYLEVIAFTMQVLDYWLRIFFVNKSEIQDARKKEFGALLEQCYKLGLPSGIYKELKELNSERVKVIHGYMIGLIKYDSFKPIALQANSLIPKLTVIVLDNCGKEINTPEQFMTYHQTGDMLINIRVTKEFLGFL